MDKEQISICLVVTKTARLWLANKYGGACGTDERREDSPKATRSSPKVTDVSAEKKSRIRLGS